MLLQMQINVKDLVKRLSKPWINSGRNLTMDNYFTSVDLATDMMAVRTTIVGTIRKNKGEIPIEMQAKRQREVNSSLFGFHQQLTLTSYVPKKNKAVILLSSMHHDNAIDEQNSKKPEIIIHYNATKSGVDNLDHLVKMYTCKRKKNRWPMTMFFNILDCAGVAAYVTWTTKNPDWNGNKHHKRRLFIKELGNQLVERELLRRQANPQAMQRHVRSAMIALGREIQLPTTETPSTSFKQRCHLCDRSADRKVKILCSTCGKPCCRDHAAFVCQDCQ